MKKKALAAALGALLLAGAASAVEVNPGGRGDVLLAPMVMTAGGWGTELKVINTSTVDSAVAKVVFHGAGRSEELLDFLIFLSPGDVWTGNVQMNADGSLGVRSADGSSLTVANKGGTGADRDCPRSTANAVGFDPAVIRSQATSLSGFAYANIFQSRMIRGLGAAPVAKSAILAAYSAACSQGGTFDGSFTDDVLTGTVTLSNPQNGNKLTLPMTALAGYNNDNHLKVGPYTGFGFPAPLPGLDKASKAMVEDALWASNFVVPFNNAPGNLTYGIVSFPTKETRIGTPGSQYAAFFPVVSNDATDTGTAVPVSFAVRDEEENQLGAPESPTCIVSPCPVAAEPNAPKLPREVNIIAITRDGSYAASTGSQVFTQSFTKGWVNIGVATDVSDTKSNVNYNNFGRAGAPALTTYINWDFTMGSLQGTWQYAPKAQTPAAYQ